MSITTDGRFGKGVMICVLLLGLQAPAIGQQDPECDKWCGKELVLNINHRMCSYMICGCHITQCNSSTGKTGLCWEEGDTYIDRGCFDDENECYCRNAFLHLCLD